MNIINLGILAHIDAGKDVYKRQEGYRVPFSSFFQSIIPLNINPLNSKVMNNKKKNEGQTDFSYYAQRMCGEQMSALQ